MKKNKNKIFQIYFISETNFSITTPIHQSIFSKMGTNCKHVNHSSLTVKAGGEAALVTPLVPLLHPRLRAEILVDILEEFARGIVLAH